MPHRIPFVTNALATVAEGAVLIYLSVANGWHYVASIFSDEDWNRITGPHGVAFISLAAVVVLWGNGIRRERNEERRREIEEAKREKRHAELVNLQKENAEKLTDLTVQAIITQGKAAEALRDLTKALDKRP